MRCKGDNVQSCFLAPTLKDLPNHHNFHICIARSHNGGTLSESSFQKVFKTGDKKLFELDRSKSWISSGMCVDHF